MHNKTTTERVVFLLSYSFVFLEQMICPAASLIWYGQETLDPLPPHSLGKKLLFLQLKRFLLKLPAYELMPCKM